MTNQMKMLKIIIIKRKNQIISRFIINKQNKTYKVILTT